ACVAFVEAPFPCVAFVVAAFVDAASSGSAFADVAAAFVDVAVAFALVCLRDVVACDAAAVFFLPVGVSFGSGVADAFAPAAPFPEPPEAAAPVVLPDSDC
ncbi:hypothetical protein ACFV9W_33685, partial [Streptomyces sp. NPDC059897]|uniref:hypothetical protein n=1 Tax=Streptomyces sp. NPDC059897 TaxID=3346994 RepID=UPI003655FDF3